MIRILTGEEVEKALPMRQAIEAVKEGFAQLSAGRADVPLRTALDVPAHNGVTLFMPAYLARDNAMAVKIVSVFNDNPEMGLPLVHALVVVVDEQRPVLAAVDVQVDVPGVGADVAVVEQPVAGVGFTQVDLFLAVAEVEGELRGVLLGRW